MGHTSEDEIRNNRHEWYYKDGTHVQCRMCGRIDPFPGKRDICVFRKDIRCRDIIMDAGRRALTLRRDALRLVANGKYQPKSLTIAMAHEMDGALIDGEVMNTMPLGMSPWYRLTDAGRERLAELEGMGLP